MIRVFFLSFITVFQSGFRDTNFGNGRYRDPKLSDRCSSTIIQQHRFVWQFDHVSWFWAPITERYQENGWRPIKIKRNSIRWSYKSERLFIFSEISHNDSDLFYLKLTNFHQNSPKFYLLFTERFVKIPINSVRWPSEGEPFFVTYYFPVCLKCSQIFVKILPNFINNLPKISVFPPYLRKIPQTSLKICENFANLSWNFFKFFLNFLLNFTKKYCFLKYSQIFLKFYWKISIIFTWNFHEVCNVR